MSTTTHPIFETPRMQELLRLLEMWIILAADVSKLESSAKEESVSISFVRRQYARAAAALVEGFVSMLKQDCLLNPEDFLPEEVLMLKEKVPILKDNGEVCLGDRFVGIEPNLRFAVSAYAKRSGVTFKLDCSQSSWQEFGRLFKIRNRISHPRNLEELSVTDNEMDSIKQALEFVNKTHRSVQYAIESKILMDAGASSQMVEEWRTWTRNMASAKSEEERKALYSRFLEGIDGLT
jgi:hypothetical protein